ncbi:MAG: membrane protein insertion efficiency factor YidD [Candidatus Omnitrophota bacterium]|nr:membrane protein insertion efficiency factor YidD [Candidatus Omnitrophota bacterium]
MAVIFRALVKGYQCVSRQLFPPVCRFTPSCSQYALDAVSKYGLGRGLTKAFLRILKCNPFFKGGYDPV